ESCRKDNYIYDETLHNIYKRAPFTLFGTGPAEYKGEHFPDCGETSLRNIFNVFLYDSTAQLLRVELLDKLAANGFVVSDKLIEFYKKYPGIDLQNSLNARKDWALVVSNLNIEQGSAILPIVYLQPREAPV
ncbi:MAG: hypothetical protein HQK53_17560, partial [Oligoflexia bacterium]|nr:hypothetical protein [Oligoflexia bacterium]